MDVKLMTHNVNGIGDFKTRKRYFNFLSKLKKDIILLQETHSTEKDEPWWRNQIRSDIIFSHGTSISRGVCIILRRSSDIKLLDSVKDKVGRFICIKVEVHKEIFVIVNVYAPNNEKEHVDFFTDLYLKLQEFNDEGHKCIIGGDFNFIQDLDMDREGGNMRTVWKRSCTTIGKLKEYFYLIDIWRTRNQTTKRYTWRRYNPYVQSRLDFWLITETLQTVVVENDIHPCVLSDHDYVTLHLHTEKQKVGPSYWKFNNSLLRNEEFVTALSDSFSSWVDEYEQKHDKKMLWDWLKYKIRDFTIPYSKKKKCEKEKIRQDLEEELKKINERTEIEGNNLEEEVLDRKKNIEKELHKLYDHFAEGAILRSRCSWYEKGEKSNKYFLSLEKRHVENTYIDVLDTNNGIAREQTDIQRYIKGYFLDFFQNRDMVDTEISKNYICQSNLEKLTESEKISCEGLISCNEAKEELMKMAKSKTPGNDGLTVEFYETFWSLVSKFMIDSFNAAYEDQSMSASQRQGVIKLIPKPNKEKHQLNNWRPITLINVDAKILSKCLAKRISKVIGNLINYQQTAFIKGRYIGEGIRLISDLMFYAEKEEFQGIIMALDLTKAFDTLSHSFLFQCLEAYNFGSSIIQWVKTVYKDISSCVLVNGFTTGYFKVSRGVRQGDPLAPLLFILGLEVYLNRVRNNCSIKGFKVGENEIKYTAYADDITCFCENSHSLQNVFLEFEEFSKMSGLCISKSKTEGMWIGKNCHLGEKDSAILWPEKGIKVLGIFFSYDVEEAKKRNFESRINEMRMVLDKWKNRGLTLIGKTQILKTFIMSKIIYLLSNIALPIAFVKEVEKLMFSFMWNGPDKIARATMFAEYSEGGLKFPNIQCMINTQLVKWVQRYFYRSDHSWTILFERFFKSYGGKSIFVSNYAVEKLPKIEDIPPFYIDLLKAWLKTDIYLSLVTNDTSQVNLLKQGVWNNKYILINNQSVYCRALHEAGLSNIYQLFDDDGNFLHFNWWNRKGVRNSYFLQYMAIIQSVKKKWKCEFHPVILQMFLDKDDEDQVQQEYVASGLYNLKPKIVYMDLLSEFIKRPVSEQLFSRTFDIQEEDWSQIYTLPFKCTIETKMRVFQFKLIHNILYTNYRLCKMKVVDSEFCTFCHSNLETPIHLFYECDVISKLRQEFVCRIGKKFNVKSEDFSRKRVMFGFIMDWKGPHKSLLNHLVLMFKRYVYIEKCKNTQPHLKGLISFISNTKLIELNIAKLKNIEGLHYKKWTPVEKLF